MSIPCSRPRSTDDDDDVVVVAVVVVVVVVAAAAAVAAGGVVENITAGVYFLASKQSALIRSVAYICFLYYKLGGGGV